MHLNICSRQHFQYKKISGRVQVESYTNHVYKSIKWGINPFFTSHDFCHLLSHLYMLSSVDLYMLIYCKQYGPRSDCSKGTSLISVHTVCFLDKSSLRLTGPRRAVGNGSDCRVRGCEIDPVLGPILSWRLIMK